jgi:imidazolonepropionase-like amidohydrolase
MGEENLRRMADQGVCWVPTVVPMAVLAEAANLTSDQIDIARRTVDHQLAQIQKAIELGVVMALGTDAGSQGVDHGAAVRQELALLMTAGMRLAQAVQCATGHTARLLRLADRGELRLGCRADFLVVDGNPDRLLSGLEHIASIWVGGRRILDQEE